MNENITVAIIGAGQRGQDTYGNIIKDELEHVTVVGVAEPIDKKRENLIEKHQISSEYVFTTWEDLLAVDKFCDAVLICTPDDLHYEPAVAALEKGYHVLLEKPMVNKLEYVDRLEEVALNHPNQVFMVCHVLRYTPFFTKIKEVIKRGDIGALMSVQHNENIGYYHMAHSFVRGNWRIAAETSPMILAKSCHDLDILNFLVESPCTKISSFGQLSHFNKRCQPIGASERCVTCGVEASCPYSAKKIYLNSIGQWPASVITLDQTKEGVMHALEVGPYGRCVYTCDNDVVDHQATIIEYENGVSATFNLSGFTHDISRTLKVMGSHGEIRAHMELNQIDIHTFGSDEVNSIIALEDVTGHVGHGGGDGRMLEDFISIIADRKKGLERVGKTNAMGSLESHRMAFAAEASRLENKVVVLKGE